MRGRQERARGTLAGKTGEEPFEERPVLEHEMSHAAAPEGLELGNQRTERLLVGRLDEFVGRLHELRHLVPENEALVEPRPVLGEKRAFVEPR